jgi:trimeric autotransporter adhesin
MKKTLAICGVVILFAAGFALIGGAQVVVGNGYLQYVWSVPSGSCGQNAQLEQVVGAGTVYTCQSGTWAQVSGGGSGTITGVTAGTGLSGGGTSGTVTVNLTTPVTAANGGTGVANTATLTLGTSNQNWATLGTGIVKNTTTTGALTNAASADILGLCTTCVTSAASLTSTAIVTGSGSQGIQTAASANTLTTAGLMSLGAATCTTPGTAGGLCATEGTSATNVASASNLYPDSTAHEWKAATNGATTYGIMVRAQPGAIRSTGLLGSVSTATLCAASAGACNVSGTYHVHFSLYQSGTACTANTTNGVSVQLTWTDANATAHSAQTMPMDVAGGTIGTTGVLPWTQTTLGAAGSVDFNVDTNGTIIQYATTFTQCTTGTATYALSAVVTRLQ